MKQQVYDSRLAAERTLLAWIRTGLAMIAFGFVIDRFGIFIRELAVFNNLATRLEQEGTLEFTLWLGGLIIIVGTLFNMIAAWQFKQVLHTEPDDPSPSPLRYNLSLMLAYIVSLIGVGLVIYIFTIS